MDDEDRYCPQVEQISDEENESVPMSAYERNASLTQRISAENMEKAREAFHALTPFGPTVEAHLYNERERIKQAKLSAPILPMIQAQPSGQYINNSCFIPDLAKFSNERALINYWTPEEHEIFKEKYLEHPKKFDIIASFLEKKSTADCVQHYYLTKKQERYKQQLLPCIRDAGKNNVPVPSTSRRPRLLPGAEEKEDPIHGYEKDSA